MYTKMPVAKTIRYDCLLPLNLEVLRVAFTLRDFIKWTLSEIFVFFNREADNSERFFTELVVVAILMLVFLD